MTLREAIASRRGCDFGGKEMDAANTRFLEIQMPRLLDYPGGWDEYQLLKDSSALAYLLEPSVTNGLVLAGIVSLFSMMVRFDLMQQESK